ncbi:MAG TPA: hypothetical protein VMW42_06030 [Desulfatiglandales bacterium]|nr:hypothetical protein [Desulfatiglandales bacterium]
MSPKNMKKYLLVYELEIEAKNIRKAEEIGDQEETKIKAGLRKIEGEGEAWERFYNVDPSVLGISSFKSKRK